MSDVTSDVTDRNATAPKANANATGYVAVLRTAQGKPERRKRRTRSKTIREATGRIVAAYLVVCRETSAATPSRMDIAILATQSQNLLAGGYDERDIRAEAVSIASEFDLYHGHRGMTQLQRRVQRVYAERAYAEHELIVGPIIDGRPDDLDARLAARRSVFFASPLVLVAEGVTAHRMPARPGASDPRDEARWTRRCAEGNCLRTALYGRERCGAHEP